MSSAGEDKSIGPGRVWLDALSGAIELPLWVPVAMGTGIACYFALPVEPPFVAGLAAVIVSAAFALLNRKNLAASVFVLVLAATVGFLAGELGAFWADAPVLNKRLGPVTIEGRVVRWEEEKVGQGRLTLGALTIHGLAPGQTPARVRLVARTGGDQFQPGDRIRFRAILQPPPVPSFPGDFDYARQLYFARTGALGFVIAPIERLGLAKDRNRLRTAVEALRTRVSARIREVLPGDRGAVADALVTGHRQALKTDVVVAMRGSGLAHLLAISGLHLGLVTGVVFFALRALLALSQRTTLYYPIKKWAAAGAIPAAAFYLLLSGAGIPTIRAFIMVSLVLLAVILDRNPISLRLVAVAASLILLFAPEALLTASFQMSFSAVVAMIVAFTAYSQYSARRSGVFGGGWSWRIARYFLAVAMSTLIAEAVLVPTVLYQFHRMALYGLVANLFAMPIMAFWIMPAAVLAMVCMPFGLDSLALRIMGEGISWMLYVARSVSGTAGSMLHVPAFSTTAYATMMAGILALCLLRGKLRLLCLPIGAIGIALAIATPRPDILVDGKAEVMAVRAPSGDFWFSPGLAGRHARSAAAQLNGQVTMPRWTWKEDRYRDHGRIWLSCDARSCLYAPGAVPGMTVALIHDPVAALEDCRRAKGVIAFDRLGRVCRGAPLVIDWAAIQRDGGQALFLENGGQGTTVRTVRGARGLRPWT